MLSLIIDTSTEENFLALAQEDLILAIRVIPPAVKQSKVLISEIKNLLDSASLTPNALTSIAISIGPGSFSGTRVGIMTAKALAYALHLPLITFSSLEAYTSKKEGLFGVILDAKAQSYYFMECLRKEGRITPLTDPLLLKKEEIPLIPLISPQLSLQAIFPDLTLVAFNAPHVASLIYRRWKAGKLKSASDVTAFYLRSP